MIERANVEAVKYRIAVMALGYYADKSDVEPGYSVDEDLQWCLQPFLDLAPDDFAAVYEAARATIIDPTAQREHLTEVLDRLVAGGQHGER